MSRLEYTPLVGAINHVDTVPLGPKHVALLFDEIVSEGFVEYAFFVVVLQRDSDDDPILFITSEVNACASPSEGYSHFLGMFNEMGHSNFGASDDWANPDIFFPKAVRMAAEELGVAPDGIPYP